MRLDSIAQENGSYSPVGSKPSVNESPPWNATRYTNSDVDKKIQSLTSEVNAAKRNATIADIWKTLSDDTVYIALHHQTLAYAMKREFDIQVSPDNQVHMKFIAAKQ